MKIEQEAPLRGSKHGICLRSGSRVHEYDYYFAAWLGRRAYLHMRRTGKRTLIIKAKASHALANWRMITVHRTALREFRTEFIRAKGCYRDRNTCALLSEMPRILVEWRNGYLVICDLTSVENAGAARDLFEQVLENLNYEN